MPLPQTSAADLDELEEAQAVADTKQKLFLGSAAPDMEEEKKERVYMLCRTYMNTPLRCVAEP